MSTLQERKEKHYALHNKSKEKLMNRSGIYGIWVNDVLVYIGQSKNLFNRFVAHQMNTTEPQQKEYYRKMYVELRKALWAGATIEPRVIEYAAVGQLTAREQHYLSQYQPPLNCMIGGRKKQVLSISYCYAA